MGLTHAFRRLRGVAAAAVVALGLSLAPQPPGLPSAGAQPSVPDAAPDEAAASVAARQGNKPVLVESKTDETTEVRANPDGTFTMTQHVQPVRVKRGDTWTAVDTTLAKHADGTISPLATVVDVELSAGGPGSKTKPTVMARKDSTGIGLGWQSDLPEASMSGPTATYPNVLPDVDLKITVDATGFSEVLVINTPQAARNPNLRRIAFDTYTDGLTVTAAEGGALRATDPTGTVVFTGDASRMWDSSGDATAPERLRGAGDGLRTADMGVEVAGTEIAIVPDQDFLAADDIRYPVYIDPSYRCTNCGKAHHNVLQSAFPNNRNFDRTDGDLNDLKAGYWCEPGDCPQVSRTYLRMNTSGIAGKWIFDAVLHVGVIHSAHCNDANPTELWWTQWMDESTSWNNQPAWIGFLSGGNRTNNARFCASDGGMDLNAMAAIVYSADHHVAETTFVLKGENEGGRTSWRRFDLNPYLVVNYNSRPNPPRDLGMEGFGPNADQAIPCRTGTNRSFLPTRTPRLRARITDPDGGMMDAGFRAQRGTAASFAWDGKDPNGYIGQVPSGSFAEVTMPSGVFPSDGIYTWRLWSGDYHLAEWSPMCEFELDTIKPLPPSVGSPQYPADRAAGGVGQAGSFTFTANTGTNDTAYYLYSFTTQGDDPQTRLNPATLNGSVTLSWNPTLSGPQTLSVRAVDRAGNRSEITRYKVVVSDYQVGISGKVAQWSLEGSLRDSSGAKALSYEGPPPGATYGPGHQGQGVLLAPVNTEFYHAKDALVRTDTSFTVSAWANLNRNDQHSVVASQDGDRLSGFFLHYNVDQNRWLMTMSDRDSDSSPVAYSASSTGPPTLNAWTHLTGVFDAGARKLRIYVNGTLHGEADAPPAPWNATGQFVAGAGKMSGQRAHHFSGGIDSVRMHARALSAAEITALSTNTGTANPTAEYLFENNLNNSGANSDLAQPASGIGYAPGYAGGSMQVGSLTGPLALTPAPLINTTGSYSVAAWVKLADKSDYYVVASQDGDHTSGFSIRYSLDADRWFFGMSRVDTGADTVQWAFGQTVPKAGVWTHLAAVHDAGTHKILLYVNGMLDAQQDLTGTISAGGPFVLGAAKHNDSRVGAFKGQLDEINVFDGVLKPGEVAALANVPVERARYRLDETGGTVANDAVDGSQANLYGTAITWGQHFGAPSAHFSGNATEHAGTIAGSGPVARWDLNNRLTDSSGNGRTLVHTNNTGPTPATYGSGRINEGVVLNGVDRRLTTSGPVIDTTRSYSVSAWVKLTRNDGWFAVASQDGSISAPFALMYSDSLDRWTLSMMDGNTANPGVVRAASKLPPELGVWTHLLGVYDAQAGRARLFVNGQLEGDVPVTATWPATGPFSIGRLHWNRASKDHFAGTIDEVRVYDRVLTESDAHGLWNLGSDFAVPRPAGLRTDQSFVVAAWARHGGYDAQSRQVVATDGNRFGPLVLGYRAEWRRWAVLAEHGSEAGGVGRWVLSDNEAGSYADPNGWVHLAAVYDAPARTVRLYVNGVRQLTVPTGPTTVVKADYAGSDTTLWDNGRGLLIGRLTWLGQPVDSWKGAIRDVRIFSGVLPEACDNLPTCMSQLPWQ